MANPIDIDFHFDETTDVSLTELSATDINDVLSSGQVTEVDVLDDSDDSEENFLLVHDTKNSAGKTWDIHVATIGNWPEFKTKTCYKWVRIPLNGRTKVPYPCVWRRTCKKAWYLRITYGGSVSLPKDIEKIIKDCVKVALVPALPILLTGNVGAAVAAFLAAFKKCLIAKGVQEATSFSASFYTRKTCGKWKRV